MKRGRLSVSRLIRVRCALATGLRIEVRAGSRPGRPRSTCELLRQIARMTSKRVARTRHSAILETGQLPFRFLPPLSQHPPPRIDLGPSSGGPGSPAWKNERADSRGHPSSKRKSLYQHFSMPSLRPILKSPEFLEFFEEMTFEDWLDKISTRNYSCNDWFFSGGSESRWLVKIAVEWVISRRSRAGKEELYNKRKRVAPNVLEQSPTAPLLARDSPRFECSLRIISSPCSLAISNRRLSCIIIQSFEKTNLVPLQSCFDKVQSLFFSFRAAILILSFLPSFEIPSIHEYKYVFIFNGSTLVWESSIL